MTEVFFLAFLGLLGLLRIGELIISKQNWKSHGSRATQLDEPLFKFMVCLHISMFVLLPLELLLTSSTFGGWLSFCGLTMTAIALILRVWTLASIGKSWNVKVVFGEDYPIVSHGPYRYVRHPNYLVVILELAFIPLIHGLYRSALVLSILNLLVLRVRIRNEEQVLFKNPQWVAKMAKKPRFIPRLGNGREAL